MTWMPIDSYRDDGEAVVVWNGQPWLGYYQDPDGWFADVDGELLRIDPPPTHWVRPPATAPSQEPPMIDAETLDDLARDIFAVLCEGEGEHTEELDVNLIKGKIRAYWDHLVVSSGAKLIAAERQRQMDMEGWTTAHDDTHTEGELVGAALCYASYAAQQARGQETDERLLLQHWPWDASWWKPRDPISNLVRAGALIAAEIERLQRRAAPSQEPTADFEATDRAFNETHARRKREGVAAGAGRSTAPLVTAIADAVQESGRKHCSGEILIFDRYNLEQAIDAGFAASRRSPETPHPEKET